MPLALCSLLLITASCAAPPSSPPLVHEPVERARVFTSTVEHPVPTRFFPLDGPRIVMQVVNRSWIAEGAMCELRVQSPGAASPAYVARWKHQRSYDDRGIPAQARRFEAWRQTPGVYRLQLFVNERLVDEFAFELREDLELPLVGDEPSVASDRPLTPASLRQPPPPDGPGRVGPR